MGINLNTAEYAKGYESGYAANRPKTGEKATEQQVKEAKVEKSEIAAVYENRQDSNIPEKKEPYSINKKSQKERAAIVEQLKSAEEEREKSLSDMVRRMISGQKDAFDTANNGLLTKNISAEAIRRAKEDISEDGYYGVKQTSQRLFDFAGALAGDDVEKMRKMQAAMNKGIEQAAAKLGGLPSICKETQTAANKLFDEYYDSKGVGRERGDV